MARSVNRSILTSVIFPFVCLQYIQRVNSIHLYVRYISHLEDLERFESVIVNNLTQAILTTNVLPYDSELRQSIEIYLRDYYESSGFGRVEDALKKEETSLSKNPICAFRLIRRAKIMLPNLVWRKSFRRTFGALWKHYLTYFWSSWYSHDDDWDVVRGKLLRLQLFYDFNAETFANGLIPDIRTNCSLNSLHCYEISKAALAIGQYAYAIEWMELAKKKALTDKKASLPFVEFTLWNAIEAHNLEFDEDVLLDLEPVFFNRSISHIPGDNKNAEKLRNIQYEAYKGFGPLHDDINFWALCSGENFQTEKAKSSLFCWYEFKIHPGLLIGPRKVELITRNPDVVQIYEVIYDNEINDIIDELSKDMQDSTIIQDPFEFAGNRKLSHRAYSSSRRTSVNARVEFPKEKLGKRIEQITGLVVVKSGIKERLQMASYSFGGHNFPHMDQMSHNIQLHGDHRLATFIFYFNDVEKGGYTAFTSLGVAAKPSKGSALFWFNLYTDRGADWATFHGACPVLRGSKWAANKWITYQEQFSVRKCGLKPRERFQIPANGMYLPLPDASPDLVPD